MWLQPHQRRATATTIKVRNERGMIHTSVHLKAEKLEEQHHNVQHANTQFLLALPLMLFLSYGD
jgi:hypothetical protein